MRLDDPTQPRPGIARALGASIRRLLPASILGITNPLDLPRGHHHGLKCAQCGWARYWTRGALYRPPGQCPYCGHDDLEVVMVCID